MGNPLVLNCVLEKEKNLSQDGDAWVSGKNRYDCPSDDCTLKIQTSDGLYGLGGGTATRFTRVVDMEKVQDDVEYKVKVTITWKTGTISNQFVLENYMYDISL